MSDTPHKGGCHCGAVSFTFKSPGSLTVTHCNCSICSMTGYEHLIIPQKNVDISGEKNLSRYAFGTEQAQHLFCKICGIKSFYIPRSHPDCYSVNLRCVSTELGTLEQITFDGQNWEQSIQGLKNKV